jgi:peptide/nickel transport system ATP-binding protein
MKTDALLELRDVSRSFIVRNGLFAPKKQLQAVRDVSLKLMPGDVLALVGESGCGKTTLAKMLLDTLPPSSGQILRGGSAANARNRRERTRQLQAVFQDPYSSLNPRKTIGNIVSLPLRVHQQGNPAEIRATVDRIMNLVGLPPRFYNSYPNQLSGGQRQRVAIARALVLRPEIIICDEPTSALDVSVQSQILNLLIDLRAELGLSYLFISHDLAVVEHLASKVAVMYLGRIVESGNARTIFDNPRHPYTRALLASVLTPDPGKGVPDIQLGATFPNPLAPPSGCAFHPRCPLARPECRIEAPPNVVDETGAVECHLYKEPIL